jgi:hypothetical protein
MLMKNQYVTEDGKYVKNAKAGESKTMYSTMLAIRAGLVGGAGTDHDELVSLLVVPHVCPTELPGRVQTCARRHHCCAVLLRPSPRLCRAKFASRNTGVG